MGARRLLIVLVLVAIIPLSARSATDRAVEAFVGTWIPRPGHAVSLSYVTVGGALDTKHGYLLTDDSYGDLSCLEVVESRDDATMLYASFSTSSPGNPPELAVMAALVESGIVTEGVLGLSDERTSPDRCGAAAVDFKKVDGLTVEFEVAE